MEPKLYDWDNQELEIGDEVTFGEKHTKGTVLGVAEDLRLMVEVIEIEPSPSGKRNNDWKYIYMFPAGQAHKVQTKPALKEACKAIDKLKIKCEEEDAEMAKLLEEGIKKIKNGD